MNMLVPIGLIGLIMLFAILTEVVERIYYLTDIVDKLSYEIAEEEE